MQHINRLPLRRLVISISASVLMFAMLVTPIVQAQGSASGSHRECNDNAVLRCGSHTTKELRQRYDSQDGAKDIFTHFGIDSSEVSQMHSTAVNGHVTKGGRVMVGDKTVATGATTAGRQNMYGSSPVNENGTKFYTRPPSVSFNKEKLDAYVVMKNGKFQYAVIKECGNPVKATPVEKTKPKPKPQPAPPAPAPAPPPPAAPAAVQSSGECRIVTVIMREDRQVNATVTGAASNARITGFAIDFGDGSVIRNIKGGNNSSGSNARTVNAATVTSMTETSPSATHKYNRDGDFVITGYVTILHANGQSETKTAETCQQPIKFNAPVVPVGINETVTSPPPPPPPAPRPAPAPAPLPDTGAGEAAGISAIVGMSSTFGYALYTWMRGRFGLV